MNKRALSVLLLTAAFPLAASAQTTAPAPGGSDPSTNQTQQLETNQNNAHGGMNDARPLRQSADASPSSQGAFVTVPQSGAWRVSDLEGKAVYGADGQNIGSIGDVLVSQDGSVNAVIIGVGGFLGLGQKDVAVDMSALELGPGATQEQADAASQTNPGISGETTASTQPDPTVTQEPGPYGTTGGEGTTAMGGAQGTTTTGTGMPADSSQMAANDPNAVRIGEDGLPDRIILNVTRDQLEDAPEFEGVRAEQR
ncbi:sporulation protein YlmC with PRC-barrel domain [Pseudorhizobium tarimense]|uniref:Sporulation protein YlmC with PRC-barrel domain n=1 Tax=Pseudorhizobium tarimense TaxID=1079109 RepID=A0ABV2H588_9HYPH|nr:PRC-barrel domain-containing protein [Pseudorhizobium tarimense]MCJ8518807.1 PRC-barrel domain-containing protein [Pseudorhizobium tarimense]